VNIGGAITGSSDSERNLVLVSKTDGDDCFSWPHDFDKRPIFSPVILLIDLSGVNLEEKGIGEGQLFLPETLGVVKGRVGSNWRSWRRGVGQLSKRGHSDATNQY